MAKAFTISQLAEGINRNNLGQESARMTAKWAETGLLEGLSGPNRAKMSRLLEEKWFS